MERTKLILVGGFLGAGKTTLLAQAAQRLAQRGHRVGLITNDQAGDLMDTGVLRQQGLDVGEVTNGCFCCHFDDLLSELGRLKQSVQADYLIGEPVGSCTDLSATVLQRIKSVYADDFAVAPFSVLLDPARAREALAAGGASPLPDTVVYIYRLQLEEADLIVLNKCDLLAPAELDELVRLIASRYPGRPIMTLSALTGDGVDAWLDRVTAGSMPAGQRIATVDYDTYARGEAALGWLNASVRLHTARGADWAAIARRLLVDVREALISSGAEIAHAKLLLTTADGWLAANLTGNQHEPAVRAATGLPGAEATLTLNVRAHSNPDALRQAVSKCLQLLQGHGIQIQTSSMRSFSPPRPQPTHRYPSVAP